MKRRRTVALASADVGVLGGLRGAAEHAAHHVTSLPAWFAEAGTDHALAVLAGGAVWLVAAWVALAGLLLTASALPGLPGAVASGVGRAITPRVVRAALAGWAGVGVALAPAAAFASSSPGADVTAASAPPIAHSAAATPLSDRRPPAAPLPAPMWPDGRRHAPRTGHEERVVRVRAGDCLWLLAGRRLAHEEGVPVAAVPATRIAAAWPRWYARNRAVIGGDPDVLRPGERLHPPLAGARRPQHDSTPALPAGAGNRKGAAR